MEVLMKEEILSVPLDIHLWDCGERMNEINKKWAQEILGTEVWKRQSQSRMGKTGMWPTGPGFLLPGYGTP